MALLARVYVSHQKKKKKLDASETVVFDDGGNKTETATTLSYEKKKNSTVCVVYVLFFVPKCLVWSCLVPSFCFSGYLPTCGPIFASCLEYFSIPFVRSFQFLFFFLPFFFLPRSVWFDGLRMFCFSFPLRWHCMV